MAMERAVMEGEVLVPAERYLSEVAEHLPALIQQGYRWHNPAHQKVFTEDVEALWLVAHRNLETQVTLYQQKIYEVVTEDQAEYTHAVVMQRFGYRGQIEHLPQFSSQRDFRQLLAQDREQRTGTNGGIFMTEISLFGTYSPLDSFNQRVPLSALRVMAYVEQAGIVPDSWWVKKNEEIVTVTHVPPRIYRDPWLIASFGTWGVIVAAWI